MTIRTRPEEDVSYTRAQLILPIVVVYFLIGSIVEAAMYWLFNYKVINIAFYSCVSSSKKCNLTDKQTDET